MIIRQYRVKINIQGHGDTWLRWTDVAATAWPDYVADAVRNPDRFEVRTLVPADPVRELLAELDEHRPVFYETFLSAVKMRARFDSLMVAAERLRKEFTE